MSFNVDKLNILYETPVEYLPRISGELGVEFYIKRDDLTPLGAGGNKLRKLEYLVKDAMNKGATMLITVGGGQTNHGRQTAAMAAKYGMKCAILAVDEYPGELSANMLLDRLFGCELYLKRSDGRPESLQLNELVESVTAKYEALGEKVYFIPVGGSNVLGALGYYDCALELDRQARAMGLDRARVIDTVGSTGTYAGLYLGLRDVKSDLHLTGIAIMPFGEKSFSRLEKYMNEVKDTFGMDVEVDPEDFDIETGYVRGGYNLPSKEVREAIELMASQEGILLDPCYTGKAFAGIMDMIREGKIARGEKIIFIHTGGMPGLYTPAHRVELEKELMDGVHVL
ncbi:MAG: D-cysteine desulfhydrase family protein [Firmicutes bacterium]|nr:D-cysteine desulfhydrase family protein [Bacillota bacterium]